ncbi:MAG: AAA family ATPase [Bacteriovoracaceae bacterium]|nr:AAA family ATPase [Bacteriovoracaceae bacterium]
MSRKTPGEWLLSQNSSFSRIDVKNIPKKSCKTIAVSSGKGGVGKTSVAIKLAKLLVEKGERVLLIDCDYNLSNTAVKLGFPLEDKFYDLLQSKIEFDEAIHKDGDFHLLSACNGNLDIFENDLSLENLIIDIVSVHREDYDSIILDCPAGLTREICTLSSYCDYRFVVITPDKSSITDSYSLIKVLSQKLGVREHHLIFNKISNEKQYDRLTKTFLETASLYLDCRLNVLGAIPFFRQNVDLFDQELLKVADSKIHNSFNNVINKFAEENIGSSAISFPILHKDLSSSFAHKQDVQSF